MQGISKTKIEDASSGRLLSGVQEKWDPQRKKSYSIMYSAESKARNFPKTTIAILTRALT